MSSSRHLCGSELKNPFEEIRGNLTQITEYKLVWLQEGEALETGVLHEDCVALLYM